MIDRVLEKRAAWGESAIFGGHGVGDFQRICGSRYLRVVHVEMAVRVAHTKYFVSGF
jgi:hypothetical protein